MCGVVAAAVAAAAALPVTITQPHVLNTQTNGGEGRSVERQLCVGGGGLGEVGGGLIVKRMSSSRVINQRIKRRTWNRTGLPSEGSIVFFFF